MTVTRTLQNKTDNITKLSVLSLNINGLSKDKKRSKLFEKLINKNIDIILLQKTHSTKKTTNTWEKEWLGKLFWNSGKITKSSGAAILLKQNLNIEINTTLKDEERTILPLNFTFEKQNFQIINIYVPTKNSEKPKFYKHLKQYINIKENVILGGNFNMVEDPLLDRQGGNPNNNHMLGLEYLLRIFA